MDNGTFLDQQKILDIIHQTGDIKQLDALKLSYLGKAGIITQQLKALSSLFLEERKEKGSQLNNQRDLLNQAFQERYDVLRQQVIHEKLLKDRVDVTLNGPVVPPASPLGMLHPLTCTKNRIATFFTNRGFQLVTDVHYSPEIETEWHNFDALNIPAHHPARQSHDTFYCADKVLRTHTSTVQVRFMKDHKPPFRMISLGRVYRKDDLDATHTPMFHQLEGLVIEENLTMAHLKRLLHDFCAYFFNCETVPLRFRPSYFPFTVPSAEVDIACTRKNGTLTIGTGDEWMEVLGCGMVHPKVLANCGIDATRYSGLAFGMGIERFCMLANAITDIRQFYDGDIRWIQHFGSPTF